MRIRQDEEEETRRRRHVAPPPAPANGNGAERLAGIAQNGPSLGVILPIALIVLGIGFVVIAKKA